MPMSDYLGWIHGKADRSTGTLVPVRLVTAGTTYSEDQIDFGTMTSPSTPTLATTGAPAGIPSLFPNIANSSIRMGLHIIITEAYNSPMTSCTIFCNTSSTNALTTGTVLTERVFTVAQMAVLGAHYFIPLPPGPANILEFLAAGITVAGGTPTTGSVEMWYGPDADGAI